MAAKVQLWGWSSTKSLLRMHSYSSALVYGCACGMTGSDGFPVKKIWRLCSSSTLLIDCMALNVQRTVAQLANVNHPCRSAPKVMNIPDRVRE